MRETRCVSIVQQDLIRLALKECALCAARVPTTATLHPPPSPLVRLVRQAPTAPASGPRQMQFAFNALPDYSAPLVLLNALGVHLAHTAYRLEPPLQPPAL